MLIQEISQRTSVFTFCVQLENVLVDDSGNAPCDCPDEIEATICVNGLSKNHSEAKVCDIFYTGAAKGIPISIDMMISMFGKGLKEVLSLVENAQIQLTGCHAKLGSSDLHLKWPVVEVGPDCKVLIHTEE